MNWKARYEEMLRTGKSGSMSLSITPSVAHLQRILFDLIGEDKAVKKVVDFGCGPGKYIDFLKRLFPEALVTGVDMAENILKVCKKKFPKSKFQTADKDFPVSVDVFFSSFVFQHLSDPDMADVLGRMKASLTKKGKIYVIDTISGGRDTPDMRFLNEEAHSVRFGKSGFNTTVVSVVDIDSNKIGIFKLEVMK